MIVKPTHIFDEFELVNLCKKSDSLPPLCNFYLILPGWAATVEYGGDTGQLYYAEICLN